MTTLNLANAIKLGSTNVSRAYLGATQVWPAVTVTPVSVIATTVNDGPINSTGYTVAKPAGAQAGDYVMIAVSVNNRPGLSPPAGFDQLALLTTTFDTQQLGVFGRLLDGTEGASFAGSFGVSAYNNWVASATLLRGVKASAPVGVAGTLTEDSAHTGTFTATVPGVMPAADGSAVLFVAATDINAANAGDTTYSVPTGFAQRSQQNSTRQVTSMLVAAKTDVSAGTTGDVSTSVTTPAPCAMMGVLLPINADAPIPMAITGTLPDVVVGAAYNASLTLTGDFTAPVTLSYPAGTLPSWLAASVSGSTIGFTGTAPASAESVSFTVRATDANLQVADSAQSFAVSDAPPVGNYIKLSTTRKAAFITVDGTGLVASTIDSASAGTVDAAACVDASTANRYWEVSITAKDGTAVSVVGVAPGAWATYGSALGLSGDANAMGLASNGAFNRTWGSTAVGYTFGIGDTVMLWLYNGSLYMGTTAAGWFGGASGGVPTTALATGITGTVGPAYSSSSDGYGPSRAWTFNFGASAWQGTPPAGATGWTA